MHIPSVSALLMAMSNRQHPAHFTLVPTKCSFRVRKGRMVNVCFMRILNTKSMAILYVSEILKTIDFVYGNPWGNQPVVLLSRVQACNSNQRLYVQVYHFSSASRNKKYYLQCHNRSTWWHPFQLCYRSAAWSFYRSWPCYAREQSIPLK